MLVARSVGLLKTNTSSARFQAAPPVFRRTAAEVVLVLRSAMNVEALTRLAAFASARQKESALAMPPDGTQPDAVTKTWCPSNGMGVMSTGGRSVRKQYRRRAVEQPLGMASVSPRDAARDSISGAKCSASIE